MKERYNGSGRVCVVWSDKQGTFVKMSEYQQRKQFARNIPNVELKDVQVSGEAKPDFQVNLDGILYNGWHGKGFYWRSNEWVDENGNVPSQETQEKLRELAAVKYRMVA